jgi:structure-specific recognition protein 1
MSGNKTIMNILNKYNEYIVKNMELDEDDVKKAFDAFVKDNKKEINKKEKKPKDKNAPKRATTPYMAFCAETRPKLKKEGLDFAATASKLGEMWGKLTDKQKQKFVDIAEKDKKRYQEEMANYTPPEGDVEEEKKKGSGNGKRGKSGYQLFCAEMRPAIKKENPEISFKDMNKELGGMWAKVSKAEKDEWNNKAKGDGEAKMPKKTDKKSSKKKQDEEEIELDDEEEEVQEDEDDQEEEEEEEVDYSKKTLAELKEIAKEKGVKGYAKMKKDELIEAIENA